MSSIGGKIYTKLKEGRGPVKVISSGTVFSFDSVEEAKKFWTECYYGSEGHEQSRYADILMQLASGKTNISDGTDNMVKSGKDLYNNYKEVKDTNIYKSFSGYNDDGTNKYVDVKIGEDGVWKTPEDWFNFMNGAELARNPEAWREFSSEMNSAGYKNELSGMKDYLEKGFNVKLESVSEGITNPFEKLLSELSNVSEMYDETDESGDVFAGTEDSYANEMLDQNVSDIIMYSDIFKDKQDDYDLLTNIINDVIDYIVSGNGITAEWLNDLLTKYNVKY